MNSKEIRRRRYCTGITSESYIRTGVPTSEKEKRTKEEIDYYVKQVIEDEKKEQKKKKKKRGRSRKGENIVFE